MAIDPLHSSTGGAAQAGPAPSNASDPVRSPTVRQDGSDADPGDTIQLSTASLALQAQAGEAAGTPPSGTMSSAQLQVVLGRVASGYYDQPDVRDAVVQGVTRALMSDGTEY
jgi:hypothetical protein